MRILLASAFLLVSGAANANLSFTHFDLEPAAPLPRLIDCMHADDVWHYNIDVIRTNVATALAAGPEGASVFITQAQQASSPYDLPDLLESANMIKDAQELRKLLGDLESERVASCRPA